MTEENNEEVAETTETTEAVETNVTASEETNATTEATATEESAFSDTFIESISDEGLKGNKLWERLKGKSADEFAKYVTELQSWNGKKGEVPTEESTPEEWSAFYDKMGRPETIDGYDFSLNDEFKELVGESNTPYYQQMIDGFKEQAHELGLNPEKASGLVGWYLDKVAGDVTGVNEISSQQAEANDAALGKEWGDSRQQMEGAIHALLSSKGADIEALKATGILSDPAIAIPLGKIASDLGDDPEIGHHMTTTLTGIHDQLGDVNEEIKGYMRKGKQVPSHLKQKRTDLMNKAGDNL